MSAKVTLNDAEVRILTDHYLRLSAEFNAAAVAHYSATVDAALRKLASEAESRSAAIQAEFNSPETHP